MTTNVQPHQEQLFDTGEAVEDPSWKLDDDTRRIGRRGLKKVRDELEKHPAPVAERKPKRRRGSVADRADLASNAYIARAYKNAA